MHIIYSSIIFLYGIAVKLASFFNQKAKLWIKGRQDWRSFLVQSVQQNERWIWFHCSSLGEFEDIVVFLDLVKKNCPNHRIALTFFSPSGYEAVKHKRNFDMVMYLPLDLKKNTKFFLDTLRPEIIFYSRSELWYNFLMEIKQRSIPAFLLSLRLDGHNGFLKWPVNHLFKRCFFAFTFIFCLDWKSLAVLIGKIGYKNSVYTGNARVDRIFQQVEIEKDFHEVEGFIQGQSCIVAGSISIIDYKKMQFVIRYFGDKIKWILVPHEITEAFLQYIMADLNGKAVFYSRIESLEAQHNVLVIDHIGSLKYLYNYANLAIVGGGFTKKGIHNIIEPALHGVYSLFGPNHRNYQEAFDLLEMNGCNQFSTEKELQEKISQKIMNPIDQELQATIKDYVKNNRGSSQKMWQLLVEKYPDLFC
jgi:3-deoxy-D-manno-octulosonic-acid transferase